MGLKRLMSKPNGTNPPFAATPMLESAGFVVLSTVFWVRDLDERVSQRFKKVLSRSLAAVYSVGTAIDPMWEQRWGPEAHLQIHFWTGAPFPLLNHPEHPELHATAHSPAPMTAWDEAFELSLVSAQQEDPTLKSIRTVRSSTPLRSTRQCFADAETLPVFQDLVTPGGGPATGPADVTGGVTGDVADDVTDDVANEGPAQSPAVHLANETAEKPLSRTLNQNHSTRRRLRQKLIFQKWMRGRAKKAAAATGYTPIASPIVEQHSPAKSYRNCSDFKSDSGPPSRDALDSSGNDTNAFIAQQVLNAGELCVSEGSAEEAHAGAIICADVDADIDGEGDAGTDLPQAGDVAPIAVISPIGKRERLKRVFKRPDQGQ